MNYNLDDKSLLFFDVETPNRANDSICAYSLVEYREGQIVSEERMLVNPNAPFDDFNIGIHHITPDMVEGMPTFDQCWVDMMKRFEEHIIVAHNATFDLSVLSKDLKRYGITLFPLRYMDTMRIAQKHMFCYRTKSGDLKLSNLCQLIGRKQVLAHDPLSDALDCKAVYDYCLNQYHFERSKETKKYNALRKDNHQFRRVGFNPNPLKELVALMSRFTNDDNISIIEAVSILGWFKVHEDLIEVYPYDQVYAAINQAHQDGVITPEENQALISLCSSTIDPIAAKCQEEIDSYEIIEKTFCLSGDFHYGSKSEMKLLLLKCGAKASNNVTRQVDYVVVGGLGNDSWAYGKYGTKVEKALEMQNKGSDIVIMSEADLFKCLDSLLVPSLEK